MLLEERDHVHVLLNHLQGVDPIQDLQGKDHAQDLQVHPQREDHAQDLQVHLQGKDHAQDHQVQWNLVHLQKGQIMEKDRATLVKLLYMNLYLQDHWHLGEIQD